MKIHFTKTTLEQKSLRGLRLHKRKHKVNTELVQQIILEHTPKLKVQIMNRLTEEPFEFKPSEMGGGGGSKFLGLPLPLLPDISISNVTVGEDNKILEVYGISQRADTEVALFKGTNRKANRHLKYQYIRMLECIGGTLDPREATGQIQVKTKFNFNYRPKGGFVDEFGRKVSPKIIWSLKLRELMEKSLGRNARHALKRRTKTFWHIAMDLLVNSKSFRLAVLNRTLAKHGWFHRAFTVVDLRNFNDGYRNIADNFKQEQPVSRCWIPQGESWRPLGIAAIPWRIYSRGLGNILEVFLRNGWPDGQHGYTTGRGVHTAWRDILTRVIHSKNIFEFDFVGFFNNVNLESVSDSLKQCGLPKWMVQHYMFLVASDVKNITSENLEELRKFPTWVTMWKKHEYIHKYRKGWRHKGLAQGSTISPILSVLPLALLVSLTKQGITYIGYADDGLLHGNVPGDYGKILQELLDSKKVGAIVHPLKSKWVKKDSVWLGKLKFVGLIYDPGIQLLSACTRGGATLDLSIKTLALLDKDLPYNSPWTNSNNHIPLEDLSSRDNQISLLDKMVSQKLWGPMVEDAKGSLGMMEKAKKTSLLVFLGLWLLGLTPHVLMLLSLYLLQRVAFTYMSISRAVRGAGEQLKEWNMNKVGGGYKGSETQKAVLMESYLMEFNARMGDDTSWSPLRVGWWDHVSGNPALWYWYAVARGLDPEQARESFGTCVHVEFLLKMEVIMDSWTPSKGPKVDTRGNRVDLNTNTENAVRALLWYKTMAVNQRVLDSVSIQDLNKKIGEFKLVKSLPADISKLLPEEFRDIQDWTLKNGWEATLAMSQLGWESVVDTKLLGTFVSRLFVNSFQNEGVVQDFSLKYNPGSLVQIMAKTLGRGQRTGKHLEESLGMPLNVFNSTSTSIAYAIRMLKLWDKLGPNPDILTGGVPRARRGHRNVTKFWKIVYQETIKKISSRRTGWTARGRFVEHEIYGWRDLQRSLAAQRIKNQVDYLVPVDPQMDPSSPDFKKFWHAHLPTEPYRNLTKVDKGYNSAVKAKVGELAGQGLQWETITNTHIPEFKLGPDPDSCFNQKPAGTDWFTWAPYIKGPRRKATRAPLGSSMENPSSNGITIKRYDYQAPSTPPQQEPTPFKISRYWRDGETGVPLIPVAKGGTGTSKITRCPSGRSVLKITKYCPQGGHSGPSLITNSPSH